MKSTTAFLAILLCLCLLSPVSAQEENKGQLWYCYEETVKPGEVDVYKELSKEMLVLCKEANFPFPIYTWTPGEFKFQLWSPINNLDDIDKIGTAWNNIEDSWDQEKLALFNSTKIKNFSYTVRALPEISYEPDNPRYTMDEVTYGQWNELYLIPGKVKEAKKLIKEFIETAKSKDYDDPWTYFEGGVGYETPVLIGVSLAKNKEDLLQQDKKFSETFDNELDELANKFYDCVYTRKNKEWWWLKDLTYNSEE